MIPPYLFYTYDTSIDVLDILLRCSDLKDKEKHHMVWNGQFTCKANEKL